MKIYLAHPISGKTRDEVLTYFKGTSKTLSDLGYTVFQPMTGKEHMRVEKAYRAHGYTDNPLSQNHAIVQRDFWMASQADIIYTNLLSATEVSIGCVSEIAWAYTQRKNIIVAKPEEGMHHHAFILEMASVIFHDHKAAMTYLKVLFNGHTQPPTTF